MQRLTNCLLKGTFLGILENRFLKWLRRSKVKTWQIFRSFLYEATYTLEPSLHAPKTIFRPALISHVADTIVDIRTSM